MNQNRPRQCVLTINGGSSSVKFALFALAALDSQLRRLVSGQIDRVGQTNAVMEISDTARHHQQPVRAITHREAAERILEWVGQHWGTESLGVIGHRLVHGGLHVREHQRLTPELLDELRGNIKFDLAHLPREITLIEECGARFPEVPQVACFDTVFHRSMPRVAQLLPIPRRYSDQGFRRLGFHGLSYTYLLDALTQIEPQAAKGRVVLAHLGSGASMAAVSEGKPVDTTMGFTPVAGLVMGTRPGDLDPGMLAYLVRSEKFTPDQLDEFLNRRCGLLGVSEISADMRELIAASKHDVRAAEAVELFCYRARQWIGTLAAAMDGVDTIVFAGGIGERSPQVRSGICRGLTFLGIELDESLNTANGPVISKAGGRTTVRVIPTDEETVIARIARQICLSSH